MKPTHSETGQGGRLERRRLLFVIRRRTLESRLLSTLQTDYDVHLARGRGTALAISPPPDAIILHLPSVRFNLHRFFDDGRKRWPKALFLYLAEDHDQPDGQPSPDEILYPPLTPRRLHNLLTRLFSPQDNYIVEWEGLRLKMNAHILEWEGREAHLTPRQTQLMAAFLRAPERLLRRDWLMASIWGVEYVGDRRTMDVHIHWLRKALKKVEAPFVLETRRGRGYRLVRRDGGDA